MRTTLEGRRVAVVVDGGPAAFEAADLVRRLIKGGAEVRVAITDATEAWLPALTLETVSTRAVARTAQDVAGWGPWADAVVGVQIGDGRLAGGVGADAAGVLLADPRPARVVSPRGAPATEAIPGARWLPSGATSEDLAQAVADALPPLDLAGARVLLTAGPTREALDPVRYLTNPSSGKMGYALASAARRRGAEVVLVSGPVSLAPPEGVRVVPVVTAEDMDAAVRQEEAGTDVFVAVAAVADYRPAETAAEKIKKEQGSDERVLRLVRTPDVLAGFSARVAPRTDRPVLVGFAAETESVEANARAKLSRKGLDLVVANGVKGPQGAFGADENEVLLVGAEGTEPLARLPKEAVADRILDRVVALLGRRAAGAWPPPRTP